MTPPGLTHAAIFSFIWTWEDFLGPLVYLNDVKDYTVPYEFDKDGYPTERTLKLLRKWPMERANEALDFIASAWNWHRRRFE